MVRHIKELAVNAWPSLQTLLDGWVLRFANGYTRRANSVNLLYPSEQAGRFHVAVGDATVHEYGTNTERLRHLAPPIRAFVRQFVDGTPGSRCLWPIMRFPAT